MTAITAAEDTPPGLTAPIWGLATWLLLAATALIIAAVAVFAPASDGPVVLHHWHRTPVGFTLAELQHRVITGQLIVDMEGEIATAKYRYHANTIRLQIQQQRLIGYHGHRLDAAYLADIRAVTDYGLGLGMTMVLNAQTEPGPGFRYAGDYADGSTAAFWRVLAPIYANRRHAVFDIFNEPRNQEWPLWQAGNQSIIDMIRHRYHARNWIWVDGIHWGSRLDGVPMLSGSRIVYTYHHPGAPWPGMVAQNPTTWGWAFGGLARSGHPVVDAEFENNPPHDGWSARNHMSHRTLRAYMRYVKASHIGILVFGLKNAPLIEDYHRA
jgi:hypothetical protein